MSAEEIVAFVKEFHYMAATECLVCHEGTLYAHRDPSGGPSRKAPATCGRLACMITMHEAKPIGG